VLAFLLRYRGGRRVSLLIAGSGAIPLADAPLQRIAVMGVRLCLNHDIDQRNKKENLGGPVSRIAAVAPITRQAVVGTKPCVMPQS